MEDLALARIQLKEIVDRFDVIVIIEKLFESLVLIAQRNKFLECQMLGYGDRKFSLASSHRHHCNRDDHQKTH